jgi:hypothetical protein
LLLVVVAVDRISHRQILLSVTVVMAVLVVGQVSLPLLAQATEEQAIRQIRLMLHMAGHLRKEKRAGILYIKLLLQLLMPEGAAVEQEVTERPLALAQAVVQVAQVH